MTDEFKEIAHSGGTVSFTIETKPNGAKSFQVGYSTSRPVPVTLVGVHATPDGTPKANYEMLSIGIASSPPPPNCFPVLISSDSQGLFGHNCPNCSRYWRSGPHPTLCPYCRYQESSFFFLSTSQLKYVEQYCGALSTALHEVTNDVIEIDMDAVADACGSASEKPDFYVSEESQQCKFHCKACGEFNDIIGRFGYCSSCGTRNDLSDFEENSVESIRLQLNSGTPPDACLKLAVSAFDSFVSQIAEQLTTLIPMTPQRKARLTGYSFHNPEDTNQTLKNWFGIEMFRGINTADTNFANRMFCRRHLHEHNGGVVDEKYIVDSGDSEVRLEQHLHETQGDIHRLLNLLSRMANNTHSGFHQIFPPLQEPIERQQNILKRN
jgi:hypothetical protein